MSESLDVTELLAAWRDGNRGALDAIVPIVMDELKRIAGGYLAREAHAETLQITSLVHEAYLRLVKVQPGEFETRAQFYALSAQIMRNILVDHARAQLAARRGGGVQVIPLEPGLPVGSSAPEGLVAINEALHSLEKMDVRKSRVVEMRVFGGLSNDEVATALGISSRTVIREWEFAKAWLARELNYRPALDESGQIQDKNSGSA
jgi:RNA polymerase sigma factor (TIGR02999 family)